MGPCRVEGAQASNYCHSKSPTKRGTLILHLEVKLEPSIILSQIPGEDEGRILVTSVSRGPWEAHMILEVRNNQSTYSSGCRTRQT